MRRIVRVTQDRKCYLFGRRCHHGMAGLLMALGGAVAMLHDRRDAPWL